MTTDFETQVCQLIEKGIQETDKESVSTNNVLFEECLQHLRFAHEKSKNFHGREVVLKVYKRSLIFVSSPAWELESTLTSFPFSIILH